MARELKIQTDFADYIVHESREIADAIEPRYLRRLSVYRNGFVLNGEETLSHIFPVTQMVLGQRRFFEYSSEYIKHCPASSPNRDNWGDEFPAFISQKAAEHKLDYIYDLSKFEIHLFEASRAKSVMPLLAQDLAFYLTGTVRFELIPSVNLVESLFRIDDLYDIHVTGRINNIGSYRIEAQACYLIIFQKDGVSAYSAVKKDMFNFVSVLKERGWGEDEMTAFNTKQLIEHLRHCLSLGVIAAHGPENK